MYNRPRYKTEEILRADKEVGDAARKCGFTLEEATTIFSEMMRAQKFIRRENEDIGLDYNKEQTASRTKGILHG